MTWEPGVEISKGFYFETHFLCWQHVAAEFGFTWMPTGFPEGSAGCGWHAGDAGEDGVGRAATGGSEQRIHGDDQVAPVSYDIAASERNSDQDPGTQRRARE